MHTATEKHKHIPTVVEKGENFSNKVTVKELLEVTNSLETKQINRESLALLNHISNRNNHPPNPRCNIQQKQALQRVVSHAFAIPQLNPTPSVVPPPKTAVDLSQLEQDREALSAG